MKKGEISELSTLREGEGKGGGYQLSGQRVMERQPINMRTCEHSKVPPMRKGKRDEERDEPRYSTIKLREPYN